MMHGNMIRNLIVDIEVQKNYQYEGECVNEVMEDFEAKTVVNPREFTIILRNTEPTNMIKTLAHEVVHLKQHAKNELSRQRVFVGKESIDIPTWMGSIWVPKRGESLNYDSPWEIEAYGRETGLAHRFSTYWEKICA